MAFASPVLAAYASLLVSGGCDFFVAAADADVKTLHLVAAGSGGVAEVRRVLAGDAACAGNVSVAVFRVCVIDAQVASRAAMHKIVHVIYTGGALTPVLRRAKVASLNAKLKAPFSASVYIQTDDLDEDLTEAALSKALFAGGVSHNMVFDFANSSKRLPDRPSHRAHAGEDDNNDNSNNNNAAFAEDFPCVPSKPTATTAAENARMASETPPPPLVFPAIPFHDAVAEPAFQVFQTALRQGAVDAALREYDAECAIVFHRYRHELLTTHTFQGLDQARSFLELFLGIQRDFLPSMVFTREQLMGRLVLVEWSNLDAHVDVCTESYVLGGEGQGKILYHTVTLLQREVPFFAEKSAWGHMQMMHGDEEDAQTSGGGEALDDLHHRLDALNMDLPADPPPAASPPAQVLE